MPAPADPREVLLEILGHTAPTRSGRFRQSESITRAQGESTETSMEMAIERDRNRFALSFDDGHRIRDIRAFPDLGLLYIQSVRPDGQDRPWVRLNGPEVLDLLSEYQATMEDLANRDESSRQTMVSKLIDEVQHLELVESGPERLVVRLEIEAEDDEDERDKGEKSETPIDGPAEVRIGGQERRTRILRRNHPPPRRFHSPDSL